MIKLGVNIDHVATLRQARLAKEPNLVRAALIAEIAGAEGITVHLREDRRHIQDKDVELLKSVINSTLNLEMSTSDEIVDFAIKIKPNMVTLVPEKRQELTTEGGLNLLDEDIKTKTKTAIVKLKEKGIVVSLFIDPSNDIIKISKEIGADYIEIHTGKYADSLTKKEMLENLKEIEMAVKEAVKLGLKVNAGHGLNYENVYDVAKIKDIEELNIGHSIVSRAIFSGFETAVKDMKDIMKAARINGNI